MAGISFRLTFIAFITFFIAFAFITFIAIAAWAVERCGGGSKVVLEPGKCRRPSGSA